MTHDKDKKEKNRDRPLIKLEDLAPKEDVKGGRRRERTIFGVKRKI